MFGLGFLSLIPKPVIFGAAGLVAGILVIGGVYAYGKSVGHQEGREAALRSTLNQLSERNETDAQISRMGDADRCRAIGGVFTDGNCR